MPDPETGVPGGPEVTATERSPSRQQVINALNLGADRLRTKAESNPADQSLNWLNKSVQDALGETNLARGRDTSPNEFTNDETGENFTQQEGIPTDQLIEFLKAEAVGTRDPNERRKLQQAIKRLEESSKSYSELYGEDPADDSHPESSQLHGRIKQEANLISKDHRATGTMEGDWFKAKEDLGKRRELRLPPATPRVRRGPRPTTPPAIDDTDEGGGGEPVVEPPEETDPYDPGPYPPTTPELVAVMGNRAEDAWKAANEIAVQVVQREQDRGRIINPLNWGRKIGIGMIKGFWRTSVASQVYRAMQEGKNPYVTWEQDSTRIVFADLFRRDIGNLNLDLAANQAESEEAAQAYVERVKLKGETGPGNRLLEGAARETLFREIIAPMRRGEASPLAGIGTIDINDPIQIQNALRTFIQAHQAETEFADLVTMFRDPRNGAEFSQLYATDLQGLAREQQRLIEAGAAEGEVEAHSKILISNRMWAAAEDPNYGALTRAVRWMESSRMGLLFYPGVMAVAYGVGSFARGRLLGFAAGGALGMIVAGAGIAAVKRRTEILEQASQVRAERGAYNIQAERNARGRPANREAARRASLERFVYDTASVDNLNTTLTDALRGDLTIEADRVRVMDAVADIQSRLDIAEDTTIAGKTVDLITFESKTQVEQGRLQLDRLASQATGQLRAHFEGVHQRQAREADGSLSVDPYGAPIMEVDRPAVEAEMRALETRISDRRTNLTRMIGRSDAQLASHANTQAAIAATITAATGGVFMLGSQEAAAAAGRFLDEHLGTAFRPGRTIVENIFQGNPDVLNPGRAAGFGVDTAAQLYQNPGGAEIGGGIILNADGTHRVDFSSGGTRLASPATEVLPDGHLRSQGSLNDFDQRARSVLENWNPQETRLPSIQDRFQEAVLLGRPERFNLGNLTIDITGHDLSVTDNSLGRTLRGTIDNAGQIRLGGSIADIERGTLFSIQQELRSQHFQVSEIIDESVRIPSQLEQFRNFLSGSENKFAFGRFEGAVNRATGEILFTDVSNNRSLAGTVDLQTGQISFDHAKNPNADFSRLANILKGLGFTTIEENTPSTGTTIDNLLNKPPDLLRSQGIIETDQFKKTWNFHVLRPDIVQATGMHTHNELTMHLGGTYQVEGARGIEIRTGAGPAGHLDSGAQLKGLIDSHLRGVPPARDSVLEAVYRVKPDFGLKDMLFVVNLNDGRQLMLPMDANGGYQLPKELYNNGNLVGIEDISQAYILKPDGSVLSGQELAQTGTVPNGSVVHSLAGERFASAEPSKIPGSQKLQILPPDFEGRAHSFALDATPDPTNPVVTEFTPPTVGQLNEVPPLPFVRPYNRPISPGRRPEPTGPEPDPYGPDPYGPEPGPYPPTPVIYDALLDRAFERWGLADDVRDDIRGMTPEERRRWFDAEVRAREMGIRADEDLTPERLAEILELPIRLVETEGAFAIAERTEASPDHPTVDQDSVMSDSDHGFIGVFDGVGGNPAGEEASSLTRDNMAAALRTLPPNPTRDQVYNAMAEGWRNAVLAIQQHVRDNPDHAGMATTGTVIQYYNEGGQRGALLMHSGDSRAYAVRRDGSIAQISEDDSVVTEKQRSGVITADQAKALNQIFDEIDSWSEIAGKLTPALRAELFARPQVQREIAVLKPLFIDNLRRRHPGESDAELEARLTDDVVIEGWATDLFFDRNVIYKTIDADAESPNFVNLRFGPNTDYVLVTSDGVHDNLKASEISALARGKTSADEIADALMTAARRRFTDLSERTGRSKPDDVSVAVFRLPAGAEGPVTYDALLDRAFERWGTSDNIIDDVRGRTPAERQAWLEQEARGRELVGVRPTEALTPARLASILELPTAQTPEDADAATTRLNDFLSTSPYLVFDAERDAAKQKAREFLETDEAKEFGYENSAEDFERLWEFVYSHTDLAPLLADDGTVSDVLRNRLIPLIPASVIDPTEIEHHIQVIGKFIRSRAGGVGDKEVKALSQAWDKGIRPSISPI
ncbi:protein phosphatase 2C domain-containing protein [Candidatus Daviesbacteria bacterium]|nr:protein phosphatase 2C domain-containing protein [Candidatus Daviesbacteria bacterium]